MSTDVELVLAMEMNCLINNSLPSRVSSIGRPAAFALQEQLRRPLLPVPSGQVEVHVFAIAARLEAKTIDPLGAKNGVDVAALAVGEQLRRGGCRGRDGRI